MNENSVSGSAYGGPEAVGTICSGVLLVPVHVPNPEDIPIAARMGSMATWHPHTRPESLWLTSLRLRLNEGIPNTPLLTCSIDHLMDPPRSNSGTNGISRLLNRLLKLVRFRG